MAPDSLRWAGKGSREGGRGMEGEAREAEKKVIPCIGAAGGIAQMML